MARKETVTRDFLIDAAFILCKEEGFENVTARKLANKAGCSTQPIFRLYENMEDLCADIYLKAANYYKFFYINCPKENVEPFVDLGLAYIKFAMEEKHLFRLLFTSEPKNYSKSLYEIINTDQGFVVEEFANAKNEGAENPQELFTKMWIFIHGIACMTLNGDYDLNEEQTLSLLKETVLDFA